MNKYGPQAIGVYLFMFIRVVQIDMASHIMTSRHACASFLLYCGFQATALQHMRQYCSYQVSNLLGKYHLFRPPTLCDSKIITR